MLQPGSETQFIDISSGPKAQGLLQALSSRHDASGLSDLSYVHLFLLNAGGIRMVAQTFTVPLYLELGEKAAPGSPG